MGMGILAPAVVGGFFLREDGKNVLRKLGLGRGFHKIDGILVEISDGMIACGAKEHMEAKRLLLVRHKKDSEISLILLSFRKGGKPGLIIEEAALFDNDNQPTDFYKAVYHIE